MLLIKFANDLPSNGVVSFRVLFSLIFDLLNKSKYLSIVMNHRVISLRKFDVFQDIVLNS